DRMDVCLRLILDPTLMATVLGRMDRRRIGDAQPLGQHRRGMGDKPVVTVDEIVGVLLSKRQPSREHVLVHARHPRDEAVEVTWPARLGHAIYGHATPLFDRQPTLRALDAVYPRTLTRPACEHIDGDTPADERLGELAHVARQAALDHGRVLPGEEQHVGAHPRDPIARGAQTVQPPPRPAERPANARSSRLDTWARSTRSGKGCRTLC